MVSFYMKMNSLLVFVAVGIVVLTTLAFSVAPIVGSSTFLKEERNAPATSTQGAFAFVSEFNSGGSFQDYGWNLQSGSPFITSGINYFGEPSLSMPARSSVVTHENVTPGGQFVSFQFAVNAQSGNATFAIINQLGLAVANITVSGNDVYASGGAGTPVQSGTAPTGGAYNGGWMYISGNLYNTSTHKNFGWTLQLFVDQTNSVFATVSTPLGYAYSGLQMSTSSGNAYFTNIVFSSYEIPIYLPGYNNMEGYGQGSGLLVSLLHPFTTLHANMILDNWSTLQTGILSFQINAMNYYGATRSSCVGFFQLGIDLNPNGTISPWYVEGTNCYAHYFIHSNSPQVQPGFKSPNGTKLGLKIQDIPSEKMIFFQIIDYSVNGQNKYWNATMPYQGTEFYATYTQMEFQPVAESHILDYHFNGSLYNMTYGDSASSMTPLNSTYMLPFTLDAPPTWSLAYYNGDNSGYQQIA